MARLIIILNGAKASDDAARAVDAVRAQGHQVSIATTRRPDDTERMTAEALERAEAGDVDVIIAGGGDGTVAAVFAAASDRPAAGSCSFGILPLGTANDFARCAGIPLGDPLAALTLVTDKPARRIDLARLDDRTFANAATGGFGAQVTAETDPDLKRQFGGFAYILTGLARAEELQPCRGAFEGDGFSWSGDFVAVAIGNGRQAGGGIPVCPDALLDDGELDLTIVRDVPIGMQPEALAGLLVETLGPDPIRITARSSWFGFEGIEPLAVNLDGEPTSLARFEVRCLPRRLALHVGEAAPLAGTRSD